MKFLIRFFIFLSLLCSLAFSKNCEGGDGTCAVMRDYNFPGTFIPADAKFLKGNEYIGYRMPDYDRYEVFSFTLYKDAYYFPGSKGPGFYRTPSYSLYYIGGSAKTGRFNQRYSIGDYEYFYHTNDPHDPVFTYYTFLHFNLNSIAKCGYHQEFNTDTMQCVDPCPAGQLWNVKSNSCVVDCTDEDNHKFFTSDYNCIDCSSALTIDDVARCYCTGLGSSYNPGYAWDPNKPNIVQAHCKDGSEIVFKFDKNKENPDKEKEDKDKDKEDPNKDKDKENPDKDKDKEDPSKDKDKDNNNPTPGNGGGSSGGNNNGSSGNNGGSSGGTGGGSSGGNNGGTGGTGGGSSGGSGGGTGGGSGGGQGNNNSENATPGNINYGELEERTADLANMYKKNINDLFEPIDGIKKSLNDTISKIKDGDLMSLKKGGIPNTCPLNFDIDMFFFSKKVVFDFCSILSPIASSLYVFFFVAFFLLFLFLIAKLFIFTFLGW